MCKVSLCRRIIQNVTNKYDAVVCTAHWHPHLGFQVTHYFKNVRLKFGVSFCYYILRRLKVRPIAWYSIFLPNGIKQWAQVAKPLISYRLPLNTLSVICTVNLDIIKVPSFHQRMHYIFV
jgi:hypothetical protein